MAYMNQDRKKALAPAIKAALGKHGLKGTLGVHNHSTLVLNITEGAIDFCGNWFETQKTRPMDDWQRATEVPKALSVNPYWYAEHFTGAALEALKEIVPLMNNGNHDNSDITTDYFDVGWYIDINIGNSYIEGNKILSVGKSG